ncbi:MAG: LIC_13355 family lipoprotein, partial [Leptospiraceae bacterium]|nr:LIC_13355 family lipoprotein [Leptospiraceae bacterium]
LNGAGIDFVVYENAFLVSAPSRYFIEAVIVEVSEDGSNWCGWSPGYSGADGTRANVQNPANYTDVAGITPVLFKQSDSNTLSAIDLFSTTTDEYGTHLSGGGDGFDLASVNFGSTGNGCNATLRDSLRSGGFVYVRLTTANSRNSTTFPANPDSFDQQGDIDGVVARSVADR